MVAPTTYALALTAVLASIAPAAAYSSGSDELEARWIYGGAGRLSRPLATPPSAQRRAYALNDFPGGRISRPSAFRLVAPPSRRSPRRGGFGGGGCGGMPSAPPPGAAPAQRRGFGGPHGGLCGSPSRRRRSPPRGGFRGGMPNGAPPATATTAVTPASRDFDEGINFARYELEDLD